MYACISSETLPSYNTTTTIPREALHTFTFILYSNYDTQGSVTHIYIHTIQQLRYPGKHYTHLHSYYTAPTIPREALHTFTFILYSNYDTQGSITHIYIHTIQHLRYPGKHYTHLHSYYTATTIRYVGRKVIGQHQT